MNKQQRNNRSAPYIRMHLSNVFLDVSMAHAKNNIFFVLFSAFCEMSNVENVFFSREGVRARYIRIQTFVVVVAFK